jgi:glycosyltransferase involved in cell wall biosynthesis
VNVSVIIPTYNGEKKIPILLKALKSQTFSDFEIVIVVDGSTDNTVAVLKELEKDFRKLKIVVQENQGRAVVKNRGVRECSGDLLIFYDDDMEPDPQSVHMHVSFHNNHTGLVSGNLVETKNRNDIQKYKASLSVNWFEKYNDGINELTAANLFFSAANCSMKKDRFLALGGFDVRLKDAEDYDLALRGIISGLKVYFDKSNKAIHHDRITCKSYIKRLREYNMGREKVNRLHPELKPFARKRISPWKNIAYDFFSLPIFWKMIDSFNLFMVLPRKLRYRVYDIIFYSHSRVN